MNQNKISLVPEPATIESTGRQFPFDGFADFPAFLAREFAVPKGKWTIEKAKREGTGTEIRNGTVTVWGDEPLCYATVIQLVMQNQGSLPVLSATESFHFRTRGYHVDIARDAVPTLETFKKILRWMFLLKYNSFGIYLEDLFPWKLNPRIGAHRGRLTEKELREIIAYGEQLGIQVYPSLNLCGHMEHILSIDEYWGFSEWHRHTEGCLDVSNPKAREFTYDLLREVIDFFPSKTIHIGGDESWALGRGKSLDKSWMYSGPDLYAQHHENMMRIVQKAGRQPVMWGDLLCGSILMGPMVSQEAAAKWGSLLEKGIWKEVVVANWDYSPDPKHDFHARIGMFKDRGIDQWACPAFRNSDKYYPPFDRAITNITNYLKAARDEELSGFQITAWGGECLFSFLDPLILAAMELGEGGDDWQQKWLALSGEDEKVLKARLLLGQSYATTALVKQALYKGHGKLYGEEGKKLRSLWQPILEEIDGVALPEDLLFVRKMMDMGVKALDDTIAASDYLMLSNLYSRLWLRERKPEGLGKYVSKFWSMAGKADAGLLQDNTGIMPIPLRF